jgi:hypothetical protein
MQTEVVLVATMLMTAALGLPVRAQVELPSVHSLGPVVGRLDSLVATRGFHVLSDGRVVVNEIGAGRIVVYDRTLSHEQTVIDTTFRGKIFGYLADTSLLLNPSARTLVVLSPTGTFARTMPLATTDIEGNATPFTSRVDAKGRIVYQVFMRQNGAIGSGARSATVDSMLLLRLDVGTGVIDTVAAFVVLRNPLGSDVLGLALGAFPPGVIGSTSMAMINGVVFVTSAAGFGGSGGGSGGGARGGGGGAGTDRGGDTAIFTKSLATVAQEAGLTFAPPSDAWAVLSDGAVAVVRGQTHQIDWYPADGTHSSSPPLPYASSRLTIQAKTTFVDSLKRTYAAHPGPTATPTAISADMKVLLSAPAFPDPATLPDYVGSFARVKADAENNLWLQETTDSTVWDVVNRAGRMTDRVRIPAEMTIEWFGPGVVYLVSYAGTTTALIEARIR